MMGQGGVKQVAGGYNDVEVGCTLRGICPTDGDEIIEIMPQPVHP